MKIYATLLLLITVMISTGCGNQIPDNPKSENTSASGTTDSFQPSIKQIIHDINEVNNKCRGLPGDSVEGKTACEKRDELMLKVERAGWCWGPEEAPGSQKNWIKCNDDPARAPKRQWYAHDINHSDCVTSSSPADKIRNFQEFGQVPITRDLPNDAVEVEIEIGNGKSQVWTFYRSLNECTASLPKSHKIDKKYE
ncbi:hypothetical protein [Undibacterium flavidum]|uniref:Lipoprotein n=1 Tax=Undibacterium flavidum TaxID=2762297 RepID=A0ABR6YD31_9BURK|nr:hypothetical protein [Undibacterium flavidum]MBC3874464.1 hypothetical protein [Undibacterium flavidum]